MSGWHAPGAQIALHGAALRGACGWCARTTPSGEAPPAVPTIQEQIVDKAVDVLVNLQLKFQQFYEFDILVPQIQFMDDSSVFHRDRYAQCQTVQGTVNTSQVPGMVQTVQRTVVVPQLQSIDVAVDISVVARRQLPVWLFAAVNMQRQVPAVLGEHHVQKTIDCPQVRFLADVRRRP